MIFTQHYLGCLSHASYLVGDEKTGRAVVVDPRRDIGVYLEEAKAKGLHIERVLETHVHADFLSGHLELAAATGAVISFGEAARLGFPTDPVAHGQRLDLGDVWLEVRASPGHTPESICLVVYEHAGDSIPSRGPDRRHPVRRRRGPTGPVGVRGNRVRRPHARAPALSVAARADP